MLIGVKYHTCTYNRLHITLYIIIDTPTVYKIVNFYFSNNYQTYLPIGSSILVSISNILNKNKSITNYEIIYHITIELVILMN